MHKFASSQKDHKLPQKRRQHKHGQYNSMVNEWQHKHGQYNSMVNEWQHKHGQYNSMVNEWS